jgi:undecaprenyl diphosphate synthase
MQTCSSSKTEVQNSMAIPNVRDISRVGIDRLLQQVDRRKLPAHVAIIMDGNGRWASARKLPRISGHRAGADAVRRTVEAAARLGISHLTLFAFSTENWKRPRLEVEALMRLLREYLRRELKHLQENNIVFRMIGRSEGIDQMLLKEIIAAEEATSRNSGLGLNIAINYGGRAELVDACRQIAWEVAVGRLSPDKLNEQLISERLYTRGLPDPDLLIRTSGEMRVSNFLIWQIAYSEIHVTRTLWPDFGTEDLLAAVIAYQKRERRYGGIDNLDECNLALESSKQRARRG